MKTCPFCAEQDLQDEAKVCKHCGKDVAEAEKSFYNKQISLAPIFGIFFVLAGFIYWPLWLLAVLLFILAALKK